MKRVQPMARPDASSTTVKGRSVPAACRRSRSWTKPSIFASLSMSPYSMLRQRLGSRPTRQRSGTCASASGSSRTCWPVRVMGVMFMAGGRYQGPGTRDQASGD